MSELGEFAMYMASGATAIAFLVVVSPIFRALAHRISGPETDESIRAVEGRLAALEERGSVSGEVEAQFVRIAELEERLEFTERMLAERTGLVQLPRETLQ
jgi:hypothetical protein